MDDPQRLQSMKSARSIGVDAHIPVPILNSTARCRDANSKLHLCYTSNARPPAESKAEEGLGTRREEHWRRAIRISPLGQGMFV